MIEMSSDYILIYKTIEDTKGQISCAHGVESVLEKYPFYSFRFSAALRISMSQENLQFL